jgi:hypothetical protein
MSTESPKWHDKLAVPEMDCRVRRSAVAASVMPVTHLISRPSIQVRDGRLVTVLALVPTTG